LLSSNHLLNHFIIVRTHCYIIVRHWHKSVLIVKEGQCVGDWQICSFREDARNDNSAWEIGSATQMIVLFASLSASVWCMGFNITGSLE